MTDTTKLWALLGISVALILLGCFLRTREPRPRVRTRLTPPYLYVAAVVEGEEPLWFLVADNFKSHPFVIDDRRISYLDAAGKAHEVSFHVTRSHDIVVDNHD